MRSRQKVARLAKGRESLCRVWTSSLHRALCLQRAYPSASPKVSRSWLQDQTDAANHYSALFFWAFGRRVDRTPRFTYLDAFPKRHWMCLCRRHNASICHLAHSATRFSTRRSTPPAQTRIPWHVRWSWQASGTYSCAKHRAGRRSVCGKIPCLVENSSASAWLAFSSASQGSLSWTSVPPWLLRLQRRASTGRPSRSSASRQ
mmetsp:Transcript_113218/g.315251  ORF Transcript_113218/g.315251 Transcript_113218/m.315251 type:complete len:203 (-) Transcript_113218:214-822(-)